MNTTGERAIKEALHIQKIVATDAKGIRGEANLARFPNKTEKQIVASLERNGYTNIRVHSQEASA